MVKIMMNGIVNVYKEKGYTSHDVVAKLRGILKQKKIGHTGTLDPEAEGVLPVCLGKGTRLCDMLTDEKKTYVAGLYLGITTDTQDMTGKVLAKRPLTSIASGNVGEKKFSTGISSEIPGEERTLAGVDSENAGEDGQLTYIDCEKVKRAILSFQGDQLQVPPMYSALKVNGKKLYELAREGKEVERKARPVTFYEIKILSMELPRVQIEVTCSKGTYIRTLCHDIGEKLGCGGCMETLKRIRVGRFSLEDSLTLDEIARSEDFSFIHSVEEMFLELDAVTVPENLDKALYNGNSFRYRKDLKDQQEVRVYSSAGQFIGIYRYEKMEGLFHIVKMFYPCSVIE